MRTQFRRSCFRSFATALAAMLLLPQAGVFAQTAPATFPLTVTDDTGFSTTFPAPPLRIVSLNPGLTETIYAIGAGDRVVAVDAFSNYPAEAAAVQPRLETYPSPSLETLVSLKPDVVLSMVESDDTVSALRRQGVRVLKLFPRDYDAGVATIRTLGRLFGQSATADGIAQDMLDRRDAVVAAVADAPAPRVYEELDATDATRPFVAGPNGFYGQLIDLAGGSNVFGDLPGDFGQVGAESVIQRDPEVIILTDSDLPFNPQTSDMVAARPGWDTITAVQNGAIYPVNSVYYTTFGPRMIIGLETLAARLHPDLFPQAQLAAAA